MPKELIIKSGDLAATLKIFGEILQKDGETQGGNGFFSDGTGALHLFVQDADEARRILELYNVPVMEEHDLFVIIGELADTVSLRLEKAERLAENFYKVTVPEGGSVTITTHIESGEQPQDGITPEPRGCSQVIYDLFRGLGPAK
jgi:hypothetical protein